MTAQYADLITTTAALPSVERYRRLYIGALQALLPGALEQVDERAVLDGMPSLGSDPVWTPPHPQSGYGLATIQLYSRVRVWPTVTVVGGSLRVVDSSEQLGSQRWSGLVAVDLFVQHSSEAVLAYLLERYLSALWLVAVSADPIGGYELDYDSMDILESEPGGQTGLSRMGELRYRVEFRT